MHISGQLVALKIYNNKWGRGEIRLKNGQRMVVTGECLHGIKPHEHYMFKGSKKETLRFGVQFEADAVMPDIPMDRVSLTAFLTKNFKKCGHVTAKHIIDWYETHASLKELKEILIHRPWTLSSLPASHNKKIQYEAADGMTMGEHVYRYMSAHIGGVIQDSVLRKLSAWLLKKFGGDTHHIEYLGLTPAEYCWNMFIEDPYVFITDVEGYGFRSADKIGRALGIPDDSILRMGALIHHVLYDGSDGHVYLNIDEFKKKVFSFDPRVDFDLGIQSAIERGFPITIENNRYYATYLYEAEKFVAKKLAGMLDPCMPIYRYSADDLKEDIAETEKVVAEKTINGKFMLDPSQRRALTKLLTAKVRLHTITAGPGCGKTAIMEVFANLIGGKILFCAPTGKAAKVLAARVRRYQYSASTIHSLLEPKMEGGNFTFSRNADNPIDAHIIIVDESSMVDLDLFADFLMAVPHDAHVIMLGDADQLPSVSSGNVLEDILRLPADHNRLNVTHRNDGGILRVINSVRDGHFDHEWDFHDVDLMGNPGDPQINFTAVRNMYVKSVREIGYERTALLIPTRGKVQKREIPDWNLNYANYYFQNIMNPYGIKIPGTMFRVDDRVIIRKNQVIDGGVDSRTGLQIAYYVVNGDTGTIKDLYLTEKSNTIKIELDDGRTILFPLDNYDHLDLAYASTVHASQGSEYTHVILVIPDNGYHKFFNRKILYTATSRAKNRLSIFGSDKELKLMASRPGEPRNSMLVNKVLNRLA
jgi:exodeoxyribonuclease V alpha subunit